jgi:prolyl oligopeptidase
VRPHNTSNPLAILSVGLMLMTHSAAVSVSSPVAAEDRVLPKPPPSRAEAVKETIHGVEVADPFRWLEDQKSPETRAWIEAQNKHTRAVLDPWPHREALKKRLAELIRIDTIGAPSEHGGRYFFFRRSKAQDLSVLCMRVGLEGAERVVLDPHPLSADHTVNVSLKDISDDGKTLLYGVRKGGEDETDLRLLDVDSGKDLPGGLPRANYGGASLAKDGKGFFYSRLTDAGSRVHYHALADGNDPAKDKLIFGEGYGPQAYVGAGLSEDRGWLIITVSHGWAHTEVYLKDVREGVEAPVVTVSKDIKAKFEPAVAGDRLYLLTDWKAPRGRVVAADLKSAGTGPGGWTEIVAESDAALDGISLVGGKLFGGYLRNAATQIRIFTPDGKPAGEVPLPGIGTAGLPGGRFDRTEAFFGFASFDSPTTIWRYDTASGKTAVWDRVRVPVDTASLEVRQVFFTSKDGTRVPMFLLHRKGLALDGSAPTLLYGYGGFNNSLSPYFAATAAYWAERGGIYAVANLRGGGEFGEDWHRAGMLGSKQNVFDDFLAAGEFLVRERYTRPDRLAIEGGSNGGLLVGAALTQRPELFGAVVCTVPLLDMVRYHKFLMGPLWVPEYGSADDPEQFKWLIAYSPYHRVRPGTRYPAVLFMTGDSDTRVAPLHARKMCALLQSATAGDPSAAPVLLHYDVSAGHSGAKPVGKVIDDQADRLGFLMMRLGMTP